MNDITRILDQIEQGDAQAAQQLLPLVYEELRQLAAQKLAQEKPGQTLEATALVHEAYVRLVESEQRGSSPPAWESRGHFFAAAAEAMRRILIEAARRKRRVKHGGNQCRQELQEQEIALPQRSEDLLALDDALTRLADANLQAAELVKLRYFAGFTNEETATLLGISPRKANQVWAYARAWLLEELSTEEA